MPASATPFSSRPKHFLELDGLRGIAALSVALFHQRAWFGGDTFFGHGYLAVDFFFMLSGFVLAYAYEERLRQPGAFWPYVRDRIVRLYPMLAMGALVGAVAVSTGPDKVARSAADLGALTLLNGLALPALWLALPFPINGAVWSLFFEIIANLGFGLVGPYLSDRRLRIFIVASALCMLTLNHHYHMFGFGWARDTMPAGLVRVSVSFAIGVALCDLHGRGILADGGRRWWVAPVLVATFASLRLSSSLSVVYDPLVVFLVYPVLILAGAGSAELMPRFARLMGDISYPFYLLHVPAFSLLQLGVIKAGLTITPGLVLLNFVLTVAATWLVLTIYDKPVRSALRARIGSRSHRSETAQQA